MKSFCLVVIVFLVIGATCGEDAGDRMVGANIHLREGRFDRALELYMEEAKERPEYITPIVAISSVYYMKKDYKEAVNYLEKAIGIDKKGAEGKIKSYEGKLNTKYLKWQIYYNGSVEYSKDDPVKGIELAKKALEVDDPTKVSQSYNLLANLMLKEGKKEEAKGFFMKAIETDKNNIQAYMTFGHFSLAGRDTDNALKYFNEALRIDSSKIEIYELIGQAYLLKKEHGKAIESLEKALSITGKNPTILYNLMVANYEAGKYYEAINKGKEVLGLENVENLVLVSVYNLMGQVYQKKKDYKNVVAVVEEAINKGAINCDSYSLMAHAHYKLGNTKTSSNWSKKWDECEKNK